MPKNMTLTLALLLVMTTVQVSADELTEIVQKDLVALGFNPGRIDGEMNTETAVAISQFQAQNNLEVTGQPSPQLAGIMKAKLKQRDNPGAVASAANAAPDPNALQAAQQACLEQKMAAAQEKQKKKKGFGSLMRAASRVTSRMGGADTSVAIQQASTDVYMADATASDLKSAAKDLGLEPSDVEECRNPAM